MSREIEESKIIALVAHDNRKKDLAEWINFNVGTIIKHNLVCTGTTGSLVEKIIRRRCQEEGFSDENLRITKLKSGPLGGDQQLGAMIAEGKIDVIIFFWDPMQPHPHDVDVKALLRIAVVYNIPIACNRSTADFVISSTLMNKKYQIAMDDFSSYLNRSI